ncbi:hypothetical protein [Kitasatospora sp. NPDC050463]|uniref:hypothetical protein n=1 Tax=Kitasatospora sp. NPDC050463 TaxID=3155786 RepID=UPI0033D61500
MIRVIGVTLLGPCVLFTRDKVFERFGLAVMDSLAAAQTLLRMAGSGVTARS